MRDPVELAEAVRRRAERLLVDHPGALGQPVLAERLGQLLEGRRRHREVVDQLRVARRAACWASSQHVEQAAGVVGCRSRRRRSAAAARTPPRPVVRLRPNSVSTSWTCPRKSSWLTSPRPLPTSRQLLGQQPSAGPAVKNAGSTIRWARSPVAPKSTKTVGPASADVVDSVMSPRSGPWMLPTTVRGESGWSALPSGAQIGQFHRLFGLGGGGRPIGRLACGGAAEPRCRSGIRGAVDVGERPPRAQVWVGRRLAQAEHRGDAGVRPGEDRGPFRARAPREASANRRRRYGHDAGSSRSGNVLWSSSRPRSSWA